jgi:hypothetical protein
VYDGELALLERKAHCLALRLVQAAVAPAQLLLLLTTSCATTAAAAAVRQQ